MFRRFSAIVLAFILSIGIMGYGNVSPTKKNVPFTVSAKSNRFDKNGKIEETVLIDQDNIKVTAKSLKYEDNEAKLELLLENNSGVNLTFISGSIGYSANSVNGYMMPEMYMNEDVGTGEQKSVEVYIDLKELQLIYGINSIADIEVGIYTTDDDNNETIYDPKKITTSLADTYDYKKDTYQQAMRSNKIRTVMGRVTYWKEKQFYNESDVSINSIALLTNKDGEQIFCIEFKNNSGKMVNASISNVAVNDLILGSGNLWSMTTVNAGTRGVEYFSLNQLLNKKSRDTIRFGKPTTISFDVALSDKDNNDISSSERIKIKVSSLTKSYKVSKKPSFDSNGIKVTELGIYKKKDKYESYPYRILFAVENTGSEHVYATCDYDSLLINGKTVDFIDSGIGLPEKKTGIMYIDFSKDSAKEIGIKSVDDIKNIEFKFIARDDSYNTVVDEQYNETR